jgi:AraC family transcriptional regulator
MRRRLSESAHQLLRTDKKIIEIALEYQFNNPETYSRAFKRMFGLQPSQWKDRKGPDQRLLLPRLTRDYLQHINQGGCTKPFLKELHALRLVGVMTLVQDVPAIVPQLWKVLARELERVGAACGVGEAYGIAWYPEGWATHGFLYMAAVEAASLEAAESALVAKTIAPLRCVRFVHKGSRRDLRHSLNYIYHTWLPKSGERPTSLLEIEYYGKDWDGCQDDEAEAEWELYIPIA